MDKSIKREPSEEDLKNIIAISRGDLLSVEDEVELVKQIRQGKGDVDAAKEKLMHINQRFVRLVARQYISEKYNLNDLIVEGNIGLEHAIYRFDETKGFKFISYAV